MSTEEAYKFKARLITKKDYKIIGKWYKDWGFPDITSNPIVLPKIGIIISYNSQDVIAGFLYLTDSCFAHPEWIVINKEFRDKEVKIKAFQELFKQFESRAKKGGHKLFLMSVKDKFLIRSLKTIGFLETDKEMINLIKEL